MSNPAKRSLDFGRKYPYDEPDENMGKPPPAKDWAHAAARGIVADLMDRHTIKHGFDGVDEDIRVEIVETLADIIREASKQPGGPNHKKIHVLK